MDVSLVWSSSCWLCCKVCLHKASEGEGGPKWSRGHTTEVWRCFTPSTQLPGRGWFFRDKTKGTAGQTMQLPRLSKQDEHLLSHAEGCACCSRKWANGWKIVGKQCSRTLLEWWKCFVLVDRTMKALPVRCFRKKTVETNLFVFVPILLVSSAGCYSSPHPVWRPESNLLHYGSHNWLHFILLQNYFYNWIRLEFLCICLCRTDAISILFFICLSRVYLIVKQRIDPKIYYPFWIEKRLLNRLRSGPTT